MAYTTEELIEPFWAAHSKEAGGRDPLAIQNSSVVIYTKLIRGITNVTIRIRYYGFYCWLIDAVFKEKSVKMHNSKVEQIRYMRRGELLLAFIMQDQFPEVTGISGSDFAGKNLHQILNLKQGADWDTKGPDKLYWEGSTGAFGQYFIGVLGNMDLINHPQGNINVFTLTSKGMELAEAFGKNIPSEEANLFMNGVIKGRISREDLASLISFSFAQIPLHSEECRFYQKMLLGEDVNSTEPTFHRRDSILLMLSLLQKEEDGIENLPLSFLRANYLYHRKQKVLTESTATSWYLYEMNELLHLAYEYIHAGFLYSLYTYPIALEEIVNELLKQAEAALKADKVNFKKMHVIDYMDQLKRDRVDVYEAFETMSANYKQREYGFCMVNAMQILLLVYLDAKKHMPFLETFAALPENGFVRPGFSVELLKDFVESKLQLTIHDYLKKAIYVAINQHTFSSYTKSKIGQGLVHNYLIEENRVWRVRETQPNRTSPRLQNVSQYMADLGWIKRMEKKWTITERGIKILSSK